MLDPLPGERSQLFISLPKTSSVLVDMASKTGSSHNNRNCCKQKISTSASCVPFSRIARRPTFPKRHS